MRFDFFGTGQTLCLACTSLGDWMLDSVLRCMKRAYNLVSRRANTFKLRGCSGGGRGVLNTDDTQDTERQQTARTFSENLRGATLDRSKEEMPGDVDGSVDEGGGEDRAGFAPGPAVEKSGDGGEDHVAPVGKAQVGDVREAEEDGGGPPAGEVAFASAGEHVLKEAAEEQLFRPGGEKENAERKKRKRF